MRYGLHMANFGAFSDVADVADMAARAEHAGWDGLFIWDHTARPEGVFPLCDPWVALTAVAVRTERLLLGPLVTPLSRRRPWNVSRAVVSLDHLSAGRMILGVGLGVTRGPELADFGEITDPRTRGEMLDEALDIVRAAWTAKPITYHGQHYTLDGITFVPRPVRGSVPVWGATERIDGRPVRRAATLDGVFPFGLPPSDLPALLRNIERVRGGLDGYEVVVGGTDDWDAWGEAGATWWLRVLSWRNELAVSRDIVDAGPPR